MAERVGELPALRRCFGESRPLIRFAKCLIRKAGERESLFSFQILWWISLTIRSVLLGRAAVTYSLFPD